MGLLNGVVTGLLGTGTAVSLALVVNSVTGLALLERPDGRVVTRLSTSSAVRSADEVTEHEVVAGSGDAEPANREELTPGSAVVPSAPAQEVRTVAQPVAEPLEPGCALMQGPTVPVEVQPGQGMLKVAWRGSQELGGLYRVVAVRQGAAEEGPELEVSGGAGCSGISAELTELSPGPYVVWVLLEKGQEWYQVGTSRGVLVS